MDERKDVIRLAVFGLPVTHSLSPVIHHHFARQCGIDVDYQAIECSVEEFDHKLTKFALAGGRGCNITVPLKHRAWQFAQRYSASVTLAQAANTLLFETADDCFADNTDGIGHATTMTWATAGNAKARTPNTFSSFQSSIPIRWGSTL